MTKPDDFDILFLFEGDDACVAEIKRKDLPNNASMDAKYHWFFYARGNGSLERLTFQSMANESGKQTRTFEQARFEFDHSNGKYTAKSGQAFHLKNIRSGDLPQEMQDRILGFFNS